jgi:hypothetical protein
MAQLNQTYLRDELARPVTKQSLARMERGDALDQKLYISSMLVARAPLASTGRTRRVWTLSDAPEAARPPAR